MAEVVGSKVGSPLQMVLVRKELTKKVPFMQILEKDEGARPGHLGKNIPGRGVHKYKRPGMRVPDMSEESQEAQCVWKGVYKGGALEDKVGGGTLALTLKKK